MSFLFCLKVFAIKNSSFTHKSYDFTAKNFRILLFFPQKLHVFYMNFAVIFRLDFPKPLKVFDIMGSFWEKEERELWKYEGLRKGSHRLRASLDQRFSVVKYPRGKALKPIGLLGFTLPPKA